MRTAAPHSGLGRRGYGRPGFRANSDRATSTPAVEDDDEEAYGKRSTRNRNPLPPSSGPLYPPLPPKQPKSKIKGSPSVSSPLVTSNRDSERADSPTDSEKPELPSTSNASLTPPPPGSEGALGDEAIEDDQNQGEGEELIVHEDNGSLAPAHSITSKKKGKGKGKEEKEVLAEVKVEEEVVEDEDADEEADATPRRSVSERARSQSRAKRRRGEEALLLDDHLLPAEIRRHIPPKRHSHPHKEKENGAHVEPEPEPEAKPGKDMDADVEMEEQEAQPPTTDDPEEEDQDQDQDQDSEQGQDVTRCVCHLQDDSDESMMIQCDTCNVWQHGPCMGVWADEEAPDEYFCEECRPDLHGPLKRWIRQCGRNPAFFTPPRPEDLKKLRPHNDKTPPSQSKRWTDPALMSPPPPAKPSSRSHHKKDLESPVETTSEASRRPARRLPFPERSSSKTGDDITAPSQATSKPISSGHASKNGGGGGKRKTSIGQMDSVSPNRSLSPSAHMHHAARRRITMNSRDAMYEEEVKAAMEASRREALGLPPAAEEEVPEDAIEDEEAVKEKEKKEVKKGKRKREDDGSAEPSSAAAIAAAAAAAVAAGKIKHPNQYTYRHKPASVTQPIATVSPARRGAGTPAPPVPSLAPPQHDHGTRRAGAIAHGAIANPTLSASSVASLNWYIPDHLSSYIDTLPSAQPIALDIRSQRTLPSISRNHYHNQRYGPFTEQRDDQGKLILPEDPPLREPNGEAETHLEPPARVKYPAKRITVGEMRKRVRVMLDYVYKIQSNDEKRIERMKSLGIVVTPLPRKSKSKGKEKEEEEATGDIEQDDHHADGTRQAGERGQETETEIDQDGDIAMNGDAPPPDAEKAPAAAEKEDEKPETPEPPARTSTELMEELVRDLLAFQDTFSANGVVTPMPPPIPTFDQALPIPIPEPIAVPDSDVEIGSNVPDSDIGTVPPTASTVAESVNTETVTESANSKMESTDPILESTQRADPAPAEAASIAQPELREIGTQLEMDTLLEQIPDEMSLDVYREGAVDQVITEPEEKMVLDDPASASASTSAPAPAPAPAVLESNPNKSQEEEAAPAPATSTDPSPATQTDNGKDDQSQPQTQPRPMTAHELKMVEYQLQMDDYLEGGQAYSEAQAEKRAQAAKAKATADEEARQQASTTATASSSLPVPVPASTIENDPDFVPTAQPNDHVDNNNNSDSDSDQGNESDESDEFDRFNEEEMNEMSQARLLAKNNVYTPELKERVRQSAADRDEVEAKAEAEREKEKEKEREARHLSPSELDQAQAS